MFILLQVTQIGNSNLASATAADTDNLNRIIDQINSYSTPNCS